MDVKEFRYTTIWKTRGDTEEPSAIPERKTDALRIIIDPQTSPDVIRMIAASANAYPRVRIVLLKGTDAAWSCLADFKSLRGVQVHGLDPSTIPFLSKIPKSISELYLEVFSGEDKVVKHLERFYALEVLSISGKLNGISELVQLNTLRSLHLYYVSKVNLDSLRELPGLRHLTIHHGSVERLPERGALNALECLDIWKTKGVECLAWIEKLVNLRDLELGALPRVIEVPNLKNHKTLKQVRLNQMKGLNSIANFAKAPCLQEIDIQGMNQVPIEDYEAFIGHASLRQISAGYSSKKKSDGINEMTGLPKVQYEPVWDTREF